MMENFLGNNIIRKIDLITSRFQYFFEKKIKIYNYIISYNFIKF